MAAPEAHENQTPRAEWERLQSVPKSPPDYPRPASEVLDSHNMEPSSSNTTNYRQNIDQGGIGSYMLETQAVDIDFEGVTKEEDPHKHDLSHHTTNSKCSVIELETQTHIASPTVDVLSPASERFLQGINTSVSTISTDISGPFIQRCNSQENVMDEITSAFKYAKKHSVSVPDKRIDVEDGRRLPETTLIVPTSSASTVVEHLKHSSLPFRSAPHLAHDNASNNPQTSKSPNPLPSSETRDSQKDSTCPPEPSSTVLADFEEAAPRPPLHKEEDIHGTQETRSVETKPPSALPIEGINNSPLVIQKEQKSSQMSNTLSRSHYGLTTPITASRKSHPIQRIGSSNRIRIKQPFPEVALDTTSRTSQDNTPASNRRLKSGKILSQLETTVPSPTSPPNVSTSKYQPDLLTVIGDNSSHTCPDTDYHYIRSQSPIASLLDETDHRHQVPVQQSSYILFGEKQLSNNPFLIDAIQGPSTGTTSVDTTFCEKKTEVAYPHGYIPGDNLQKQQEPEAPPGISSTIANADENHSGYPYPLAEGQVQVQPDNRPSSPLSGPRSGHNDHKKPSTKVTRADLAHPRQWSEPSIFQFSNMTKVKKPRSGQTRRDQGPRIESPLGQLRGPILKATEAYQNFVRYGQEFEDILEEYQSQKKTIELQKSDLERLNSSKVESSGHILALEREREVLTNKIKKFEHLVVKYKDHMNEVIEAQKKLRRDAQHILKVEVDMKISQEAYALREAHIKKLEYLLQEAQEFRAPAEKLLAAQQANGELLKLVQDSSKTNELLQNDLDKRVTELGRERHNVSQLQKQLNAQVEVHQELVRLLKDAEHGIINELTKEGGVLAGILNCGNSTQTKIGEIQSAISVLESLEQNSQPTLAKNIEDLYKRIEAKLQSADNNDVLVHESHLRLFEDLKEKLNQVHLDQETQGQINGCVAELREANITLTADLSARGIEIQSMTSRVEGLESELASYRCQFSAKCDELATALALPKEDPHIRIRCHELESANAALEDQIGSAAQEVASVREELGLLRKISLESEVRLCELNDKYSAALASVQTSAEEKEQYIATHKLDIARARQDVAKAADAAKSEIIMRNDALVKTLEERWKEAEAEATAAKTEFHQIQDERASYIDSARKLNDSLSACKKESSEQASQIRLIELQSISQERFDQQDESLKSALGEIAELRTHLKHIQNKSKQDLAASLQAPRDLENHLEMIDDLEREKRLLEEQNTSLQKKFDALKGSITQPIQAVYTRNGNDEQAPLMQDCQDMRPLNWPMLANGRPSSADSNSEPFSAVSADKQMPRPLDLDWHHGAHEAPRKLSVSADAGNRSAADRLGQKTDVSSADQTTPKPLKVANRRPSNLAQQSGNRELVSSHMKPTECNFQQSTVTWTSHTTEETAFRIQTPRGEIIPFSTFSPIQPHPPSSLTDVSPMMDQLESINTQEELRDAYTANRRNKTSGLRAGYLGLVEEPDMQGFTHKALPEAARRQVTSGHQSLDADGESAELITRDPQNESNLEKSSVPRKAPVPLKSALKRPGSRRVSNTGSDQKYLNKLPTAPKPATLLQSVPAGRRGNNTQSRPAPELRYKRVASGQVPKHYSGNAQPVSSSRGQARRHEPPESQPIGYFSQTSPLMPLPKRHDRKRAASTLGGEESPKASKASRISLLS